MTYISQDSFSWGCLGGVWMVSWMCLRRPQDVSIPNPLANKNIISKMNYAIILGYSPCRGKSGWCLGGVWGCLRVSEGVCIMSRWCLRVSGEASIPNQLAWIYIRPWYSDIAVYSSALYCIKCLCLGVSGLCLGMSGWGLRVSGDVFIPNKLAQIYIVHVSSDINFSSSAC